MSNETLTSDTEKQFAAGKGHAKAAADDLKSAARSGAEDLKDKAQARPAS